MFGFVSPSGGWVKSRKQAKQLPTLADARKFAMAQTFSCFISDGKRTLDEVWNLVDGRRVFTSSLTPADHFR
jgi:hypothetical protein